MPRAVTCSFQSIYKKVDESCMRNKQKFEQSFKKRNKNKYRFNLLLKVSESKKQVGNI